MMESGGIETVSLNPGIGTTKRILAKLGILAIPALLFLGTTLLLWPLLSPHSLFHDEAVYLTKGRAWIEGTPADEFHIYRPVGMAVAAWIFLHLGESEARVRIFGVLAAAFTVVWMYLLFARIFDRTVAAGVTGVVVTSSLFLEQAPKFLNDIASAGFLFGLLWLIYSYYDANGKGRLIYLAGPFAAAAFYLRYGAIAALLIIATISFFVLLPRFFKKEGAYFSDMKPVLVVPTALFMPHVVYSWITTGSASGILGLAGKAAGRKFLGEGLVNYLQWLPAGIGGWVLGLTAIFGIFATIAVISVSTFRQSHPEIAWLGSIGAAIFAITGIFAHAEARYVFFPMVLLSGAGVAALYALARHRSEHLAKAVIAALLIISGYAGVLNYAHAADAFKKRETERYHTAYVSASEFIRKDSAGKSCVVWSAQFQPAISWYARCNTREIPSITTFEAEVHEARQQARYAMVFTKFGGRQITEHDLTRSGVVYTEIFRVKNLPYGDLIVYRIGEEQWYIRDPETNTNS